MLWPWPLTPWSWTFVVGRVSCDQYMYQIWARLIYPRLSYWRLTTDFSSVLGGTPILPGVILKHVDRSAPNSVGTLSDRRYTRRLKMVKISCSISKSQWLKLELCWAIRPKIALFDPCKYYGRVVEICGSVIVAAPMTEPLVYVCLPASPRLLRTVLR